MFSYIDDKLMIAGNTLLSYRGKEKIYKMPATINGNEISVIGKGAFNNNATTEVLVIPDSIKTIMSDAFYIESDYKIIELPYSCKYMDDDKWRGMNGKIVWGNTKPALLYMRMSPSIMSTYLTKAIHTSDDKYLLKPEDMTNYSGILYANHSSIRDAYERKNKNKDGYRLLNFSSETCFPQVYSFHKAYNWLFRVEYSEETIGKIYTNTYVPEESVNQFLLNKLDIKKQVMPYNLYDERLKMSEVDAVMTLIHEGIEEHIDASSEAKKDFKLKTDSIDLIRPVSYPVLYKKQSEYTGSQVLVVEAHTAYLFFPSVRHVLCNGKHYWVYRRCYLDPAGGYKPVSTAVFNSNGIVTDTEVRINVLQKYKFIACL